MVTIQATILFEAKFWVAIFERTDKDGYVAARHIFGAEPSDHEVHEFILNHYHELNFGRKKEFHLKIKRMNPKRVQREVRREVENLKKTSKPSTHAQNYMREETEKNKIEKKSSRSRAKQERRDAQFVHKQEKKKRKKRGH